MLGKIEDRRRRGWKRIRWLYGIMNSMETSWANSRRQCRTGKPGKLQSVGSQSMTPFFSLLCIETVSFSQMLVCRLKTRGNCWQSRFLIGLQTLIFNKSLSWSMDSSWWSPDFPIWSPAPHHHDCLLYLSVFEYCSINLHSYVCLPPASLKGKNCFT